MTRATTTLQRSSWFKNLFDQLELTANKRRMATKALVSLTLRAWVKCLTSETKSNRTFLEDTYEITFSDEDIEVRYSDHKRPLYLVASINQMRALVDMGTSVNLILLSILQVGGILKNKILGHPMEVTGFGGRGAYIAGHI